MARYVVGDIQGCFDELQLLLDRVGYSPRSDQLYLVGDLVNRGPKSLEVLRWVFREHDHVSTVLGNHDLHLLACSAGIAKPKRGDTLDAILHAPDMPQLMDWLRKQPLLIELEDAVIVHAGILPTWNLETAVRLSDEVSTVLGGEDYRWFLSHMYGNNPSAWSPDLQPLERMRLAVNAFTRMRMVDSTGALDLAFKGELEKAPASLCPWFDHPAHRLMECRIVCGHWSALGLLMREDVWSLDSGCIWGGRLSAVRLDDGEVFQVSALKAYQSVAD